MQPNPSCHIKRCTKIPQNLSPLSALPAEFVNHFPRVSNYKCFWNRCIA